jgi:maltase-glucoamylase
MGFLKLRSKIIWNLLRFPSDKKTYGIDRQFLVGPALLVTPVIEEKVQRVFGYFPANIWYKYRNGQIEHDDENTARNISLDANFEFIPLHVRGGFILPTQEQANKTEFSRRNGFGLIAALNGDNEARGDLYYDDGSSKLEKNSYFYATFLIRENVLQVNVEHNTLPETSNKKLFNNMRIFMKNPNINLKFYLNGGSLLNFGNKITFETNQVILTNLSISMEQSFTIKWTVDVMNEETILDCSLQNQPLSQSECTNRGCEFDVGAIAPVPQCFIPTNVGGYSLAQSFTDEYTLKKINDSLLLFGQDVQELSVMVFHGKIKYPNSQNRPIDTKDPSRLTNIKVNSISVFFFYF